MQGDLRALAQYCPQPHFAAANGKQETAAQAAGRRYEAKVKLFVEQWAQKNRYDVLDHPWIQYHLPSGQTKYCQPDWVLLSQFDDNLLIIDAKVRHTRDVIPQLCRYRDLIKRLHPTFTPSLVEICRYFDSSECQMELLPELRPHTFNIAAVIFEPREWISPLN